MDSMGYLFEMHRLGTTVEGSLGCLLGMLSRNLGKSDAWHSPKYAR
jgi:hypothetical protein